ncbi:hypothetical protein Brsp02_03994 [Brucella sp. NBRC 113783]
MRTAHRNCCRFDIVRFFLSSKALDNVYQGATRAINLASRHWGLWRRFTALARLFAAGAVSFWGAF